MAASPPTPGESRARLRSAHLRSDSGRAKARENVITAVRVAADALAEHPDERAALLAEITETLDTAPDAA